MKKKRIPYIEFLPIILIALVLFKLLDRIDSLYELSIYIIGIFQPLLWGIGIAYVLNPMMKIFEKKLKINRIFSILLCYIIVIGIITTIITIVIPMIGKNVSDLIANFESYKETAITYYNDRISSNQFYKDMDLNKYLNFDSVSSYFGDIPALLKSVSDGLMDTVVSFFGSLFKMVVGFIIAVYILMDKEKFQTGFKRAIYGFLKVKQADKATLFFQDVNKIFSRYIIGKTIDSVIIGLMCFVGLLMLDTPYAALLAIIVGVTNMIPYFGPFIGMVPAIFLTIFFSPIKALWVGLFILGLQQFDGYILGPKILGDSVGLSPFWIILGILVGGSLMGVLGMLLAVPVVAVLQLIFVRIVDRKLADKEVIVE